MSDLTLALPASACRMTFSLPRMISSESSSPRATLHRRRTRGSVGTRRVARRRPGSSPPAGASPGDGKRRSRLSCPDYLDSALQLIYLVFSEIPSAQSDYAQGEKAMNNTDAPGSKIARWAGYVLSAVAAAFMVLDGVMKLLKPEFVIKATTDLGYSEEVIVPLGIALTICTIIYVIPQTAVLGAILLTGYLGGAVASHVRHGDHWFTFVFPVIFAAFVWGGLVLRDKRLRALVLWRA